MYEKIRKGVGKIGSLAPYAIPFALTGSGIYYATKPIFSPYPEYNPAPDIVTSLILVAAGGFLSQLILAYKERHK